MSSRPTAVNPKSDKIDGIDKWQVESAAETLIRANEIKADPKLLKAAHKVLMSKAAAATNAARASGVKQSGQRATASKGPTTQRVFGR